jgi:hypothetical protein
MVESKDTEVKQLIATAQESINKRWKEAQLPKFIQFGRDKQGAHSHALNGPAFKAAWSKPELIVGTIRDMAPVYALLETKKLTPELKEDALGENADKGPKQKNTEKKKKKRGVAWDDEQPDYRPPEGAIPPLSPMI